MKVSIEVEVPAEVAARYDVVEYNYPKEGERFLTVGGGVQTAQLNHTSSKFIILKPKYTPDWSKIPNAKAIARDKSGKWYAYNLEPIAREYSWECVAAETYHLQHLSSSFCFLLGFELPPASDDWTKDIYINPNK